LTTDVTRHNTPLTLPSSTMAAGMNQLATIIKRFVQDSHDRHVVERYVRLEAATSRLEDIAMAGAGGSLAAATPVQSASAPPPPSASSAAPVASAAAPPVELPKSLESYDANVVDAKLKPWLALTRSFACAGLIEQVRTHLRPLLYNLI
jgi:hypothetical protein